MPEDLFDLMGDKRHTGIQRDDWMSGVNAIVTINEDPEHRHRIKVIIPSIDENEIHDKWVDSFVWWTGAPGYGNFNPPEINSEVLLYGRLNEKYVLFYVARYNEDYPVPKDFWGPLDTRGYRHQGDYKSITELDHYMFAGRFWFETHSSFNIVAPAGFYINGKKVITEE